MKIREKKALFMKCNVTSYGYAQAPNAKLNDLYVTKINYLSIN